MSPSEAAAPSFVDKLTAARSASTVLATATADTKNAALRAIAAALVAAEDRRKRLVQYLNLGFLFL